MSETTQYLEKHPRGLFVLFFTELWERFSFYGMRALLVLYMTSELLFSDTKSYGIYAAYMALVYTGPVIGGFLADRILGCRRAVVFGGVLIALGHISLALHGLLGKLEVFNLFFIGLSFIIAGTGFLKSNISTLVGLLYPQGDPKRDSGFTIFYMGINIGAFFAPLLCGYLGQTYGWHYGFGAAAIGMLLGLATFLYGLPSLEGKGAPLNKTYLKKVIPPFSLEQVIYVLMFISVPLIAMLMVHNEVLNNFMPICGVLILMMIMYLAATGTKVERYALLTIMVLMFFHMSFWSLFELTGSSMTLFTERNIDKSFMGINLAASQFQSFNPMFIVLLGPFFSSLWSRLGAHKMDPYPPIKFVLALLQMALGFGVLLFGISAAKETGQASMIWIIGAYLFHTTGELCISPVGLSMVTKLAPARIMSMMMGVWFLSIAFGNFLSGFFAKLAAVPNVDGVVDLQQSLAIYGESFRIVMYFAIVMAVILLVISPMLRKPFQRLEEVHGHH